ncbi:MAG: family acetyltransferase [Bacteroidetes bacterium]|nr:family acetyltransferase [Bacteroidota bacterium]
MLKLGIFSIKTLFFTIKLSPFLPYYFVFLQSKTAYMKIQFRINAPLKTEDVIEVFKSSGLNRPVDDVPRIEAMLKNSNLVVSAWNGIELIGIARSLTDYHYCCYLSDLAVKKEHQKSGIGKALIDFTQQTIGEQTMLLLLSAAPAMEYYPKLGFEKVENGFTIKRKS